MNRGLARVFPYLLLFPAVLPLIYFDGLLYPYLTPKTLLFRADAILAVAAFLTLAFSEKSWHIVRLRNRLTWTPAVLLCVAYASSIFGVDFYHSFWSVFDRGDGLLTLTSIVALFYLMVLYADAMFVERLLKWVAVVGSLAAVFTVLQAVQSVTGMNIPLIPSTPGRLGGTLGNAAYLASYLGLTLFITLAAVPSFRGRWRAAAYWGAGFQVLAIVASSTRGSLLALGVVCGVTLLYIAAKGQKYRIYARVGIVGILVVAALFFAFRGQLASAPIKPIARIASISLQDATVESRLFIWRSVLAEPFAHPFGVGAEHIETVFNAFYDPTALVEQWFDRTHNAFIDYFVQYGFLGLVVYLGLVGVFFRESWSFAQSKVARDERIGKLFFLLGLMYVVQNVFVFDSVVTLWLFLVSLAVLFVLRDVDKALPITARRVRPVVLLTASSIVALLVVPVSIVPFWANWLLADAYTYELTDARREINDVQKGYALGTYADLEYGYQLYEIYTDRQMTRLSGEDRVLTYRLTRDILKKNYAKYVYDARTVIYYAHILDVAPKGEEPEEKLVRSVIEKAISLSPKRMQSQYLLANISIRKGDAYPAGSKERKQFYDEGIRVLNEFSDLVPTLAEPRYVIATLYQTLGEKVVAEQWAAEGRAVYRSDVNTARRAARYYVNVEDWENARFFLAEVVREDPTDYRYTYDLAKAEFLAGNVERAKEIVADIQKNAPGVVETDPAFLEAVSK